MAPPLGGGLTSLERISAALDADLIVAIAPYAT
jgi:hypothetical protein